MSNASDPRSPETPQQAVINPASKATINRMGLCSLIFATLFFYLLVTTWPVLEPGGKSFKAINIFGFWCSWAPDRQMMFTVVMAGAVGSLTHTLTSFGDYVGNRELSTNWIWFLVLRIPIGIALALLFYFIIRGGLLVPTMQVEHDSVTREATLLINPYSIAGFAALAGMFSKQATDKLAAVFDTVFAMKKPVGREAALGATQPLKVTPSTLIKGKREDLTVSGSGFQADTKAAINGKDRLFTMVDATQGKVAIRDEDVKEIGTLDLVVTNPNKDSFSATIDVVASGKPVITSTNPAQLTSTSPKSLTVIGQGFLSPATVTINGEARAITASDGKTITVALLDKDLAAPGVLKLIVKNPGPDGQTSDALDVIVK